MLSTTTKTVNVFSLQCIIVDLLYEGFEGRQEDSYFGARCTEESWTAIYIEV